MRPRPRNSTVFPYTTLFRSPNPWGARPRSVELPWADQLREPPFVGRLADELPFTAPRPFTLALDRKSTRLNSSHANTSYAVFCLKKKTTKHPRTGQRRGPEPPPAPLRRLTLSYIFVFASCGLDPATLQSFPTRRSSDLRTLGEPGRDPLSCLGPTSCANRRSLAGLPTSCRSLRPVHSHWH